jgi:hypothetical protein
MNKTTLCLISIFLSANVFAQSTIEKDVKKNTSATVKDTNTKDAKIKSFSVKPFKIPVGKGEPSAPISKKDFNEKIVEAEKVPDFVKNQPKAPLVITGKEKVFPPNITNMTAEDIKNDPVLHSNKVLYIKEKVKPPLSVVEEYNQRREMFLKKKEKARQIGAQNYQQENAALKRAYEMQAMKDEYRRKMGLPITRYENTGGSTNKESGVTREMMTMMAGPGKMPVTPPTGNVQSLPQR